jgi:hypothetical protein
LRSGPSGTTDRRVHTSGPAVQPSSPLPAISDEYGEAHAPLGPRLPRATWRTQASAALCLQSVGVRDGPE